MSGADTSPVSTVSIGLDRPGVDPHGPGRRATVNVTMKDAGGARHDSYRWLIGEKSPAFGGAIRDMWNPTCLGDPGKVTDVEYKCSADDSGGVHGNSGVVNHGYALLVDGGTLQRRRRRRHRPRQGGQHLLAGAERPTSSPTSGFPELADRPGGLVRGPGRSADQRAQHGRRTTRRRRPTLITAADCAQVAAAIAAIELRFDPTDQCGWVPQFDKNTPALCGAGATSTTVFSEDFEDGLAGWAVDQHAASTAATRCRGRRPRCRTVTTPARWPRVRLPTRVSATAARATSPARASLTSGDIVIPADGDRPKMQFTHYFATEDGVRRRQRPAERQRRGLRPDPGVGLHLQQAAGAAHGGGGQHQPDGRSGRLLRVRPGLGVRQLGRVADRPRRSGRRPGRHHQGAVRHRSRRLRRQRRLVRRRRADRDLRHGPDARPRRPPRRPPRPPPPRRRPPRPPARRRPPRRRRPRPRRRRRRRRRPRR